eukprot:gene1169-538_t
MSAVHVKGLKEALVNLDWLIQLVKDKEDDKKIWLIGGYHSKSWQSAKDQIEKEFSITGGKLKIVIAINALGMAVNYPDVRFIIHCLSPCRSLEGHIQQLGRAGTDGKQAHDITLSANKPLSECAKDVRELFKGKGCLRKGLFKFFDQGVQPIFPQHFCCSSCSIDCKCSENGSYQFPLVAKQKKRIAQLMTLNPKD